MRVSQQILLFISVLLCVVACRDVMWIGGTAGSWTDPSNWSYKTIPSASDNVIVNVLEGNSTQVSITLNTTSVSIAELRVSGNSTSKFSLTGISGSVLNANSIVFGCPSSLESRLQVVSFNTDVQSNLVVESQCSLTVNGTLTSTGQIDNLGKIVAKSYVGSGAATSNSGDFIVSTATVSGTLVLSDTSSTGASSLNVSGSLTSTNGSISFTVHGATLPSTPLLVSEGNITLKNSSISVALGAWSESLRQTTYKVVKADYYRQTRPGRFYSVFAPKIRYELPEGTTKTLLSAPFLNSDNQTNIVLSNATAAGLTYGQPIPLFSTKVTSNVSVTGSGDFFSGSARFISVAQSGLLSVVPIYDITLSVVSGGDQSGDVNYFLNNPITFGVVDTKSSNPLPNVKLVFTTTFSGDVSSANFSAIFQPTSTYTNTNGKITGYLNVTVDPSISSVGPVAITIKATAADCGVYATNNGNCEVSAKATFSLSSGGFPTWAIIVIASVGGAVVAGIIVGVIIYTCRRRMQYNAI